MALSERLAYILTLDVSSGISSVQKFGATADKELGKADAKLDKLGGNLTKFGAGAVAFAGVAGAGLVKLAGKASDLAESVNAVNVTFGDAAGGILKLGEEAARAVGLSKTEFNGLAVQFSSFATTVAGKGGDVVKTMDDITTRAADFASVMNLDVAEAARVFQSGLAGETEPLKKFGIDLSAAAVEAYAVANGITESGKAMTEAEKVQARYGALMEQTNKTAGDFANTSGGAANQQRIFKAELENLQASIGAGALPMLTSLLTVATSLTGAFSKLSPETQGMIGKFAALGVGGVALIGTLSAIAGQVIKMRNNFVSADGSLTNFGKAAKGVGVGLGIAAAAMLVYSINAKQAADMQADLNELYAEIGRTRAAEQLELFADSLTAGWVTGKDYNTVIGEMVKGNLGLANVLIKNVENSDSVTAATLRENGALDALLLARNNEIIAGKAQTEQQDTLTEATEENTTATDQSSAAYSRAALEAAAAAGATEIKTKADQAQADAAEAAADAAQKQADAINEVYEANLQMIGGDIAVRAAKLEALEAQKGLSDALEEAGDDWGMIQTAVDDATKAQLDAAQAAVDYKVQQAAANGATLDGRTQAGLMAGELRKLQGEMAPGSALYMAIQTYIDQLNAIPRSITTHATFSASSPRSDKADVKGQYVGGRALGGPVSAGMIYEVGEGGKPELFEQNGKQYLIPGNSGEVVPTSGGSRSAGGDTLIVNLYGVPSEDSGRRAANEIAKWDRKNGRRHR